jgi:competence protein ComEC
LAIISSGKENRYGHPHNEAIERLKNAGAEVLRTDTSGNIIITTDGSSYSAVYANQK